MDNLKREIKKIDSNIYNNKWQELINLLLQIDYNKRLDINQVYNILEKDIKFNNKEENNIIKNEEKKFIKYENKIIGEIYINKDNINKDIRIINSFENHKREWGWLIGDSKDDYKYENEK